MLAAVLSLLVCVSPSQGLRFFQLDNPNYAGRKGAILVFDLHHPEKDVKAVNIQGNLDMDLFNSHGLTSWANDKSGIDEIATTKTKSNLNSKFFF